MSCRLVLGGGTSTIKISCCPFEWAFVMRQIGKHDLRLFIPAVIAALVCIAAPIGAQSPKEKELNGLVARDRELFERL